MNAERKTADPRVNRAEGTLVDRAPARHRERAPRPVPADPHEALELLRPEERTLLALCCATRGSEAADLLALFDSSRAPLIVRAAQGVVGLDRSARLALLATCLPSATAVGGLDALRSHFDGEAGWLRRIGLPFVPPPLRSLAGKPSSCEPSDRPHKALAGYARRIVARLLSS